MKKVYFETTDGRITKVYAIVNDEEEEQLCEELSSNCDDRTNFFSYDFGESKNPYVVYLACKKFIEYWERINKGDEL